ncbi:MAG: hypothetical protein IT292_02340 [Deltaproteobacteria bacterium]|nr:hypothetical protein [Deltaproteobacteria bacterium]
MFWRECDATQERIYSSFPPGAMFPIYAYDYWWSNQWNPLSFGRNFSLRRPFFEQFLQLWQSVPRPAVNMLQCSKVGAVNNLFEANECYYVFDSNRAQRVLYSVAARECIICVDCLHLYQSELCYECVNCNNCVELLWAENCSHCTSSFFMANCRNCRDCMFCVNLEDAQYCIFNKQVSPEEFQRKVEEYNFSDRRKIEAAKEKFSEFCQDQPLPHIICDKFSLLSGNYLHQCREIIDSFHCIESSKLIHCHDLNKAESCLDVCAFGDGVKRCARSVNIGLNAKQLINCLDCWSDVEDLTYCSNCHNCSHLFGCIGLRDAKFCILNKQYNKNAYFELRGYIDQYLEQSGEAQEFFPNYFSPYPYNGSLANAFMPLSRVQAKLFNYNWNEDLEGAFKPSDLDEYRSILGDIPDLLDDFDSNELAGKIFVCEVLGQPFQIVPEELEFYRRLKIAPPARCFDQRQRERLLKLAPRQLDFRRSSDENSKLKTSFHDEWARPVLDYESWAEFVSKNSETLK